MPSFRLFQKSSLIGAFTSSFTGKISSGGLFSIRYFRSVFGEEHSTISYMRKFSDTLYNFQWMKTKMAAFGTGVSAFSKFIWKTPELAGFSFQQVRNKWVDWRMIRDVKRRNLVKEHAVERLCINSMRKNNILPVELREIADREIAALPRDSSLVRVRKRCVLTSRARSVIPRWRVSRIMFRELADYNKLSGVQRAMW